MKADIGVKDGRIVGIGKGGNPDTMEGSSESSWWGFDRGDRRGGTHRDGRRN
ncbi:hypothetical protein CULT_870001 [[Clostridium] ultunense Esp]|nr:hypothetical protein CULT_870001 [[Clostridium] ultunense Esp]